MGICASCIGQRRSDSNDEDEVSRLLDDPSSLQYGSFGEQSMNPQADPLESQREDEALSRVVARTSNNLVDVFEVAPHEPHQPHPAMLSGQNLRVARYQQILSKLSPDDDGADAADGSHEPSEWAPSEDEAFELHGGHPGIKEGSGEPLVGTFADAPSAAA